MPSPRNRAKPRGSTRKTTTKPKADGPAKVTPTPAADELPELDAHVPPPGGDENGAGPTPEEIAAELIAEEQPRTKLGRAVYDLVSNLSIGFMLTGDHYCANVLAANAGRLSVAWERLAQKNARVKAVLEMLTTGGEWGEAVIATLAVGIPIAQHHGAYPAHWPNPFSLGLVPPPPSDEVANYQPPEPPRTAGERQPPAGGDEPPPDAGPIGGGGPPAAD